MCILVTQDFDLSRYVRLTCFGTGTKEYLCTQYITYPLSRFFPNQESLIHPVDSSLMTYLQTIELSRGLGQPLVILTRFLVFLRPYFSSPVDWDLLFPVTVTTLFNKIISNLVALIIDIIQDVANMVLYLLTCENLHHQIRGIIIYLLVGF